MSLKELQLRAAYWQGRLNLREWKISVQWGASRSTHGECTWKAEELVATVWVNKYSPGKENILIHELLHIVLQGHRECEGRASVELERAINRIAEALTPQ